MAKRELLLVAPKKELKSTPQGLAPCYGRSKVFRPKGHMYEVEVGVRQVVSRALCVRRVYKKCSACPLSTFTVEIPHG